MSGATCPIFIIQKLPAKRPQNASDSTSGAEAESVQNCSPARALLGAQEVSVVRLDRPPIGRGKKYPDCILVNSPPDAISAELLSFPAESQEAIVTKDRVLADVVMKTVYFSLAAAALVFVSMLLLTGLHS
jgi:hypothetical protein